MTPENIHYCEASKEYEMLPKDECEACGEEDLGLVGATNIPYRSVL